MRKISAGRLRNITNNKLLNGIDRFLENPENKKLLDKWTKELIEKHKQEIRALWKKRKWNRQEIRKLVDLIEAYEGKQKKGRYFGGVYGAHRRAERRRSFKAGRGISRGACNALNKRTVE